MRGESVRSGAVIVTKTHEMNPKWTDLYQPGQYKNDVRAILEYISLVSIFQCSHALKRLVRLGTRLTKNNSYEVLLYVVDPPR